MNEKDKHGKTPLQLAGEAIRRNKVRTHEFMRYKEIIDMLQTVETDVTLGQNGMEFLYGPMNYKSL